MIWDIIRDWFVMNIWGGMTSSYQYYEPKLGYAFSSNGETTLNTNSALVKIGFAFRNNGTIVEDVYMPLGDWLSTTSTIIILIAISIGLYFLTRYFFRMFAGLLSGR